MLINRNATLDHQPRAFQCAAGHVEIKAEHQVKPTAAAQIGSRFRGVIGIKGLVSAGNVFPPTAIQTNRRREPVGDAVRGPRGNPVLITDAIATVVLAEANRLDGLRALEVCLRLRPRTGALRLKRPPRKNELSTSLYLAKFNPRRRAHNSRGLKIPAGVMMPVINSAGVTSNPGLRAPLVGLATRT